MKPKTRSSLQYCLLCSRTSPNNGDKSTRFANGVGIIGAVNCASLENQLEKMFVLLKILEVPSSLCETILARENDQGGAKISAYLDRAQEEEDINSSDRNVGTGSYNPDSWFNLCSNCLDSRVTKTWHIYQQILTWQSRMVSMKLQIKERMKKGIISSRKRIHRSSGVDNEIKKFLFPELYTKSEVVEEENYDDVDFHPDISEYDNEDGYPVNDDMKKEGDVDLKVKAQRKRGRPRKSHTADEQDDEDFFIPELNVGEETESVKTRRGPGRPRKQDGIIRRHRKPKDPSVKRPVGRPKNPNGTKRSRQKIKEGRGRPRIHEYDRKPGFRHPELYYSHHYGVLKHKRFHWKICTDCDARYRDQEDYDAHMRAHEESKAKGGGEFDCPQCPFPARDAQDLEYHVRKRHDPKLKMKPEQKIFNCSKCAFKCVRWKVLKWHVDFKHPNIPFEELGPDFDLKCKICGDAFLSLQSFKKHNNFVHPNLETQGPLECSDCGQKFLTKLLLDYHEKNVHKRMLRFICDECGMGFEFQNRLKKHKIRHLNKSTGKRSEVCHICGMDFADISTYRRHYKRFHENRATTSDSAAAPGSSISASTSEKIYTCKYCDVQSPLAAYIKRHIQETHKADMPYHCDQCDRRYTNAQGLKRHITLNHGNLEWPCTYCGKAFCSEWYMKDHISKFCRLKNVVVGGKFLDNAMNLVSNNATTDNGGEMADSSTQIDVGNVKIHCDYVQVIDQGQQSEQKYDTTHSELLG